MKNSIILLFLFLSFFGYSQSEYQFDMKYYPKCDQLGFKYYHTTLWDTNYFKVYQKGDTCTMSNYRCEPYQKIVTDSFAYFSDVAGRLRYLGTLSTFNYIHQTGVFRIKFDMILAGLVTSNQIILSTRKTVAASNGLYLYRNGTNLFIQFGSGGATILGSSWSNCFAAYSYDDGGSSCYTQRYEVILYGDGTGVTLLVTKYGGTQVNYGKLNFTGAISNTGNQADTLAIGGTSAAGSLLFTAMRSLKFYSTSDETTQYANFPMSSKTNYKNETMLGLTGVGTNYFVDNFGYSYVKEECLTQGWKKLSNYKRTTEYAIDMNAINKPATLAISVSPSYAVSDSSSSYWFYVYMSPTNYAITLATKAIKKSNVVITTKRHDIYSYGRSYADISYTQKTIPQISTAVDTSDMVLLTHSDTLMFYAKIYGDSLVWTYDKSFTGIDSILSIRKPSSTSDLLYYKFNDWTQWLFATDKHYFTIITGIRVSHRINTWY